MENTQTPNSVVVYHTESAHAFMAHADQWEKPHLAGAHAFMVSSHFFASFLALFKPARFLYGKALLRGNVASPVRASTLLMDAST